MNQLVALARIAKREARWSLFTLRTIVITAIFLLVVGFASYGILSLGLLGGGQQQSFAGTATSVIVFSFTILFFGPIIGIASGFDTVSSERTSGTLALMMSKPVTKLTLLVGKFLGRAAGNAVPIFVGLGIGFAATSFTFEFNLGLMAGHIVLTLLMVLAFQALAQTLSTLAGSDRTAILGAIAVWVLTVPLWDLVNFLLVDQAGLDSKAVFALNAPRVYLVAVVDLVTSAAGSNVPPQSLPGLQELGIAPWIVLVLHLAGFLGLSLWIFHEQDEA